MHRNDKSNAVLARKTSQNTVTYFGRFPNYNKKVLYLVEVQHFFLWYDKLTIFFVLNKPHSGDILVE